MSLQHGCYELGQMISHMLSIQKLCDQLHHTHHGGSEAVHPNMTAYVRSHKCGQRTVGPLGLLNPPVGPVATFLYYLRQLVKVKPRSTFITSLLGYQSTCPPSHVSRQSKTLLLLTGVGKRQHTTPIPASLHWRSVVLDFLLRSSSVSVGRQVVSVEPSLELASRTRHIRPTAGRQSSSQAV